MTTNRIAHNAIAGVAGFDVCGEYRRGAVLAERDHLRTLSPCAEI